MPRRRCTQDRFPPGHPIPKAPIFQPFPMRRTTPTLESHVHDHLSAHRRGRHRPRSSRDRPGAGTERPTAGAIRSQAEGFRLGRGGHPGLDPLEDGPDESRRRQDGGDGPASRLRVRRRQRHTAPDGNDEQSHLGPRAGIRRAGQAGLVVRVRIRRFGLREGRREEQPGRGSHAGVAPREPGRGEQSAQEEGLADADDYGVGAAAEVPTA